MQVEKELFDLHTGRPLTRVIILEVEFIQLPSWGWAQSCSKHVEDSNKHIIEEIVRQVGYIPELYEDAWSEKYHSFPVISWPRHILTELECTHVIATGVFYHQI
jgi:hypothetical protein